MHLSKALTPVMTVAMLSLGSIALAQTESPAPSIEPSPSAPSTKPNPAPPAPGGRRGENWIQQLNLSQDQLQKIQGIQTQYKSQADQSYSALEQARRELQDLMVSSTATDSQIREKHQQVEALQQQFSSARFEQLLAMRAVLNPDQRTKAAALLDQHHREEMNRMGGERETAPQPQ
jgi:protein CpxP